MPEMVIEEVYSSDFEFDDDDDVCEILEDKQSLMKSQNIQYMFTNRSEEKKAKEGGDSVSTERSNESIVKTADSVDYDAIFAKPKKATPTKKTMKKLDFDLENLMEGNIVYESSDEEICTTNKGED